MDSTTTTLKTPPRTPTRLTAPPGTSSAPLLIFFQAEDGIRDADVTGVQTCALPILKKFEGMILPTVVSALEGKKGPSFFDSSSIDTGVTSRFSILSSGLGNTYRYEPKIGRASCRERV